MVSRETMLNKVVDKKGLIDFLSKHMTPERIRRFNEVLALRSRHITIVAEDIYQERNASALIRTADCFGIQDVHIIENYNQYRISSSIAGGVDKWVDVHQHTGKKENTLRCIETLRGQGYRIVASSPNRNDFTPESLDISQKFALFLGGEKEGISQTILDNADDFVKIPMVGFTESFNLSVAGALLLYTLSARLHQSGINWQLSENEKDELRIRWAIKSIHRADELVRKFLKNH